MAGKFWVSCWEKKAFAVRKRRQGAKGVLERVVSFSCVADKLGAALAVVDALADADHAARRDVVGRGGLLHLGTPHAAEDLDRGDGLADGVHGVVGGGGRV